MKKRLWTILFLLLSIIMLAGCFGQREEEQEEGKDTDSGILTEMETGNSVSTTAVDTGTEEDIVVSVSENEVTTEELQETTEEDVKIVLDESKAEKVFVTASTLNLRKAPNTTAEVLKVLKWGTHFHLNI